MVRLLLSLTLVLSQLLSWGMSSVYLCVDSHGAICLDGGSESCDCCQHECHEEHDGLQQTCEHRDCHEQHEHGVPADSSHSPADSTLADSGCDCSHFQIVSQQQPTTVHAGVTFDGSQQDLVTPLADALPAIHVASSHLESPGTVHRAAPSFALLERASVCLRC